MDSSEGRVLLKGSSSGRGGGGGRSGLEGSVGHDALRELLLCLLETRTCSPVLSVDLCEEIRQKIQLRSFSVFGFLASRITL